MRWILAALAGVVLATQTAAADSWGACQSDPRYALEAQAAACTALITNGKLANGDLALAYKRRARAYFDGGKVDLAIADNTMAVRLKPDFADALANRAMAYELQHDFMRALADEGQVIAMRGNARDYFDRASTFTAMRAYPRAVADLDQAVKLQPSYMEALSNRGYIFRQMLQPDRAIADLDRAVALQPNATTFVIRGDVNLDRADYPAAIRDYSAALRLQPTNAGAYTGRARAYAVTGGEIFALQDLRRAIELRPNDADAYNQRALILSHLGQTDLALQDYGRALAINPNFAFAYNNRAIILIDKGAYREAIADLDHAIALGHFANAYQNRGVANVKLKSFDAAIEDFTTALLLAPSPPFYLSRAQALMAKGPASFERARQDIRTAIALSPQSMLPYFDLGVLDYRAGKFAEALKSLEIAARAQAELDGGKHMIAPEAQYVRGLTLKAMGHASEGQADIDAARKVYADIDVQIEERGVTRDPSKLAQRPMAPTAAPQEVAAGDQCKLGVTLSFAQRMKVCNETLAAQMTPAAHVEALMARASLFASANDWPHAVADYSAAVKLEPQRTAAHAGLAEARAGGGDLAGGISEYARAATLDPSNASFWARQCWMEARLGRDLNAALSECQHALELQPGADYLLGARGFAYFVRKEYAQAIADFDAELRIVPVGLQPSPYSLYGRGLAKLRLGNGEAGRADLAAARLLDPTIADEFASWGFKP